MELSGDIISGKFDEQNNEFFLQRVKHLNTETTIKENQLQNLYYYLKKHRTDREGHVITLYDQMPLRLSQEEINLLIDDLEKLQSMYH